MDKRYLQESYEEYLRENLRLQEQIRSLEAERDKYREALTAISRGLFSTRNAQRIAELTLQGDSDAGTGELDKTDS